MTWNSIKLFWFQQRMMGTLSYKQGSILAGTVAHYLLITGSINCIQNPLQSGLFIGYAFLVLLPLSYYQMQMSNRMGE